MTERKLPQLIHEDKWFKWKEKIFYKHDNFPGEIWINREILVQLNLTAKCPMNCEFCYIKEAYKDIDLPIEKIYKLWENLRKYYEKNGIRYRVNLTGGDIFYYEKLPELIEFLIEEESIIAVDPLINRFWKEEHRKLFDRIIDKVSYIEMNPIVVQEEDIQYALDNCKWVLLKYALYKGHTKKLLDKIVDLMNKYENVVLSFDIIIPQKIYKELAKYCYLKNISEAIEEVKKILEREDIDKNRVLFLNCILEREINGRTYLCGVGIQNIYVMPDGKIVPCSRFPHLETGYTIDNFDLVEYIKKFNKLVSNVCLFENKYFTEYWSEADNPANF